MALLIQRCCNCQCLRFYLIICLGTVYWPRCFAFLSHSMPRHIEVFSEALFFPQQQRHASLLSLPSLQPKPPILPTLSKSLKHRGNAAQSISILTRFMGDHSSATLFQVGDNVTVIEDVMKAGRNLKGLTGEVIETWEKCEVDPTCCCAEWVDEGLSVHVKFIVGNESENGLFANDMFIHYFAEDELIKTKIEDDLSQIEGKVLDQNEGGEGSVVGETDRATPLAFDGLTCKAFKMDKLKMGEQAKRIAAFEESRRKS